MQSVDIQANLALVDRAIPELHLQIDQQRQLLEALAFEGQDLTSATIVLDSLLLSLFVCVERRNWLRAEIDVNAAHAA